MERYRHRQVGWVLIATIDALIVVFFILHFALVHYNVPQSWSPLVIIAILAIALLLFGTLTISIDDEELRFHFGPGIVRRRIPLAEIASCRIVRNKWYYGWGIHRTPHGWLYNVSGFEAVEITRRDGTALRLGTDEPQELAQAIEAATASFTPSPE